MTFRSTPASAGGIVAFDISKMLGSWRGGKELGRKKHRPLEFRISNCGFRILEFSFSIRIPQSAFCNSGGPPVP